MNIPTWLRLLVQDTVALSQLKSDTELIKWKLDQLSKGQTTLMATFASVTEALAALQTEVAETKTVEESAIKVINGIPTLIDTAVQKALAAGATPEQLQAFSDLSDTLTSEATSLGAAVTANTPPVVVPPVA